MHEWCGGLHGHLTEHGRLLLLQGLREVPLRDADPGLVDLADTVLQKTLQDGFGNTLRQAPSLCSRCTEDS